MDVISFLTSLSIQEEIIWIKIGFFVFSGILFVIILLSLFSTKWMKYRFFEDFVGFFTFKPIGVSRLVKTWNKISKRLELKSEDEYKMAVLEAEEILDNVLEKMGYFGKNLKEKIDKLPLVAVSNIDSLKDISEIRKRIVYNPDQELSLDEAKKILDVFEQSLKDLQVF